MKLKNICNLKIIYKLKYVRGEIKNNYRGLT